MQEELFGFRWVSIKGDGIYINNVRRNLWNWVDVPGRPTSGEEWVKAFRAENDRFQRFSQDLRTSSSLPCREDQLELYDRNGIAGRLCSMIDGMYSGSHFLGDRTQDPVTGQPWLNPNWPAWEGFNRHLDQLTRAYRNHPSVIMYQAENELVYITGMNVYSQYLDRVEDLMNDAIEVARSNDPTRPYIVGGGGDLHGLLEINAPHYPEGEVDWYPENAYTVDKYAGKITRYPWKHEKPWVVDESAFAEALELGSYAIGDQAFRSAADELRGKAAYLRMLYGGYRWAGVAAFCPWDNLHGYDDADKVFSDLYVVPRRQTSRLYAGADNKLLFKVMNDTFSKEPVTFEWTYQAADGTSQKGSDKVQIEPGFGREETITIRAPKADVRLEGTLTLKATQPGAPDYVDVRSVPVLPVVGALKVEGTVTVLDRSGGLADFLQKVGLQFQRIEKLTDAKGRTGLLLIGPDTLTAQEALGRDLLTFAAQGGRAIVLEQDVPAAGVNLPAPVRTTTHYGGYAHPKALGTPAFRDLGKDDLIDWAGGGPVYKNVYEKPTQGARSLAECGSMLPYAPLIEMPAGDGVIVVCQLRVGANLGKDPAADVLLRNLVEHYAGYRPATGVAAVYAPEDKLLAEKVNATGSLNQAVGSVAEALDPVRFRVAVIEVARRRTWPPSTPRRTRCGPSRRQAAG